MKCQALQNCLQRNWLVSVAGSFYSHAHWSLKSEKEQRNVVAGPKSHVVVDNDDDDNDVDVDDDNNDVDVRNETDFFPETLSKVIEMPRSNFRT